MVSTYLREAAQARVEDYDTGLLSRGAPTYTVDGHSILDFDHTFQLL